MSIEDIGLLIFVCAALFLIFIESVVGFILMIIEDRRYNRREDRLHSLAEWYEEYERSRIAYKEDEDEITRITEEVKRWHNDRTV